MRSYKFDMLDKSRLHAPLEGHGNGEWQPGCGKGYMGNGNPLAILQSLHHGR